MHRIMRLVAVTLMVLASAASGAAQPAQKIAISLEARTEASPSADAAAAQLLAGVRRGLEALGDVEIVPREQSRRTIWIVAAKAAPGFFAASTMVTERYDRETLMVLGVEDEDMAHRMMALQIATDHQIYTGRDIGAIARRIVSTIDAGVFARLRKLPPRP